MALQSSFYPVDGRSRTYPQTKPIPTKQHAVVYSRLVGTNTWELLDADAWNLINNSVVLKEAFSATTYDQVEVRIADKPSELTDSISDIAVVAGLSNEITSLVLDKVTLDSLYADKATLDSLYADKATLDSLYADKLTLDSLYADKATLDSLYADKATLDSLYADKVTLDSLYADKLTLDSLYADKAKLDSLYADKATLDSLYADKVTLDSIYADKIGLDAIYANLTEILLADDNAAAAAASASSASTSASSASTSASNASASELKAQKWAEELEDVEVEVGKYSALHWAAKASGVVAAAIGVTVQGYDVDTAKTDVLQTFTAAQRTSSTVEDNTIDFNVTNDFTITLGASLTVTVGVITGCDGQAGSIVIADVENIAGWSGFTWLGTAPTLTTGVGMFSYKIIGTTVYIVKVENA